MGTQNIRLPEHISFSIFQWLGYFLGGIFPILILMGFELCDMSQNMLERKAIPTFFILLCIGILIGILVFKLEHWLPDSKGSKLFRYVFPMQAVYSIILIHLVVIYTGGPMTSVFGASYLYLLAIVGYTYGADNKLYIAAIALSESYYLNLYFPHLQKSWTDHFLFFFKKSCFNFEPPSSAKENELIYFIVYGIQIFVTVFTVSVQGTSRLRREQINSNE